MKRHIFSIFVHGACRNYNCREPSQLADRGFSGRGFHPPEEARDAAGAEVVGKRSPRWACYPARSITRSRSLDPLALSRDERETTTGSSLQRIAYSMPAGCTDKGATIQKIDLIDRAEIKCEYFIFILHFICINVFFLFLIEILMILE